MLYDLAPATIERRTETHNASSTAWLPIGDPQHVAAGGLGWRRVHMKRRWWFGLLALGLAACGGGGSGDPLIEGEETDLPGVYLTVHAAPG